VRLRIELATAKTYEHAGARYSFCCQGCLDIFVTDPEKYLREIADVIVCPTCLAEKHLESTVTLEHQGETIYKLRRGQVEAFFAKLEPCLFGIEACATAHHWAHTIAKLGHQVRLMPPAYVKPYVNTQKNDEADAEAICEAVTRPNMRFAETKTVEQQSVLVLHRTRAMLIRHRTRMGNTIRAHLAEFGITESIGRIRLSRLVDIIASGEDDRIPDVTRRAVMCLVDQY
jgi:transposase/YHS domain-containing protein